MHHCHFTRFRYGRTRLDWGEDLKNNHRSPYDTWSHGRDAGNSSPFSGSRSMSRKPTRYSDSTDEPTPRPFALLFAVVFAAAISTWHWYRPLPKQAATLANGPFVAESKSGALHKESPRFEPRWKDAGLIFPSEEPISEISADPSPAQATASEPSPSSGLTGTRDLALQPFREATKPLNQALSQMPLPMVAVRPSEPQPNLFPPENRLWTAVNKPTAPTASPGESIAQSRTPLAPEPKSDSASPFRVPRIDGTQPSSQTAIALKSNIWPDQGFDPKSIAPLPQRSGGPQRNGGQLATSSNPSSQEPGSLVSLSSNRIRTLDQDPEIRSASVPTVSPTKDSRILGVQDSTPPDPKNFIRQPSPKGPSAK
jgi:hypothetical protein